MRLLSLCLLTEGVVKVVVMTTVDVQGEGENSYFRSTKTAGEMAVVVIIVLRER